MTTINDVVTQPLKKEIAALKAANQVLRTRLEEHKAGQDVDKVNLQAKVSVLTNQVKTLMRQEGKVAERMADIKLAVHALDPMPQVPFMIPKPVEKKTPITACFHLTDWHVGEVIEARETEGWGNFNWAVAQDRISQLLEGYHRWLCTQRNGYNIQDACIICTGDFISGDIHEELRRYNEFPLPVQTAKAGQLLAHAIATLAPHFDKVRVVEIGADNHSRLVPKPQAKKKTQNSMSYLVYELANTFLERHSNLEILRAEGSKLLFDIGNYQFLGEHGDTVKSWMGVPHYGIEREKAREATRRMFDGKGFHYLLMGHWHLPSFSSIIVGGSLSGTSEYDHSCGRTSSPCQTSFLVGKRGAFNFVPFTLR